MQEICNICYFRKFRFFPKENKLFPKGGVLLPSKLGFFPKENSLLPREVEFFTKELSYSMKNLLGTDI
jgi:hypothetical protein